ncbi:MAG: hypothetical protein ACI8RC_003302, partial [Ilumatobacter sp.]
ASLHQLRMQRERPQATVRALGIGLIQHRVDTG